MQQYLHFSRKEEIALKQQQQQHMFLHVQIIQYNFIYSFKIHEERMLLTVAVISEGGLVWGPIKLPVNNDMQDNHTTAARFMSASAT